MSYWDRVAGVFRRRVVSNPVVNEARNTDSRAEILSRNYRQISSEGLKVLEQSTRRNYHTGWRSKENYSEQGYAADLAAHLHVRLDDDRRQVVPWLNDARSLRGSRILEIGCGTGSSTVALAEQGADVTGIDVDEGSLLVAKDRTFIYGVKADLRLLNATEIPNAFAVGAFDFIIFFACLEHMTLSERLASLRMAWELLPTGGLLAVVETPNRLWYSDTHTSYLPFFHWLPNDLAFRYASFSPRENFRERYSEYDVASKEHFVRRGRGASFHEFDIAIKPSKQLDVVSSLSSFQGSRFDENKSETDRQYKKLLMSIVPGLHQGFFDEYLHLVIRKELGKGSA